MGLKGIGSGGKSTNRESKGSKSKGGNSIRSFVVRTYIVGGVRVRELHIDGWVRVPGSPSGA